MSRVHSARKLEINPNLMNLFSPRINSLLLGQWDLFTNKYCMGFTPIILFMR